MLTERTVLAWHFLKEDGRLYYRDGKPVDDGEIVEVGKTYSAKGPLAICENGMHASIRALDALDYARGPIVCRVELSGDILNDETVLCARHRKVLWMADATRVLHEFACWCAEQALRREREAGREPDPRSWAAIEAKRRWLLGEIDDDQLIGAEAAARDAAYAAVGVAAKAAAWAATKAAAEAAAGAAAGAAAEAAAGAAAWAEQNAELERRLMELRDSECEVG